MSNSSTNSHDAYAALRIRNFRLYVIGNFVATTGMQMQSVAVGWEIYERTGSELALGFVGLAQFFPVIVLAIPAGHVADRYSRQRIVMGAMLLLAGASLTLAAISHWRLDHRWMYAALCVVGIARAFQQPARAAFLPHLVPLGLFSNAVTWNTGAFHLASVLGPALGGMLIAWAGGAALVYVLDAVAAVVLFACLAMIRVATHSSPAALETSLRTLIGGLSYVRRNQVLFGAITLDMLAVLLGGATMLLPVYAKDILRVGPVGLGWMRTAPAIGALCMAMLLAHRPPIERAGRWLLWSVAAFGLATIVFGLSRWYWLTLGALFLVGAFDNVSVVIRHTLVQILTPDSLRGRVSAVSSLFIGASNELGAFESGLVAELIGPTFAVVSGGVGTLLVVAGIGRYFPQLRDYGPLVQTRVPPAADMVVVKSSKP